MRRRRSPNETDLARHAAALFGVISLALASGCEAKSADQPIGSSVEQQPSAAPTPAIEPTTSAVAPTSPLAPASAMGAPTAAASIAPATSAAPTASASIAPTASAAAAPTASASAKAKVTPPPPKKPKPTWVEGRPFLVDDVARLAALGAGPGWAEPIDLDGAQPEPEQRAELVRHYTRWALAEHASIAAFARFSLQLLALGAPSDLVSRAASAMADETRHAQLGFSLVAALPGATLRPDRLPIEGALDAVTLESALRLTVREGILGETLAALEARLAADRTSVPSLKERLVSLAADESRHAELAFVFAAWAVGQSPELARVVEEEVEQWQPPPLETASGLEDWGVLDAATRRVVRREGLALVVRPLVAQLVAGAADVRARPRRPGRAERRASAIAHGSGAK